MFRRNAHSPFPSGYVAITHPDAVQDVIIPYDASADVVEKAIEDGLPDYNVWLDSSIEL